MLWHQGCVDETRLLVWALHLASIGAAAQLVVHGKIVMATIIAPILPLLLMKLFIVTLHCVGGGRTCLHLKFLLALSVRCLVLEGGGMVITMSAQFLASARGGILSHLEIGDV